MSKWVLLWGTLFQYNLSSFLFSRDKDELREKIAKALALDVFYFAGDDLIGWGLAKILGRWKHKELKGQSLTSPVKIGRWTFQRAIPVHEMLQKVGVNHPALRFSKQIFMGSLAATALCLGVATTLLNNFYTNQKVRKEQADYLRKKHPPVSWSRPLYPAFPAVNGMPFVPPVGIG